MWDKYLETILKLTNDTDKTTKTYKSDLLKYSMINAHKKNKMKPVHYLQWVKNKIVCLNNTILQLTFLCYLDKYLKFHDRRNFGLCY